MDGPNAENAGAIFGSAMDGPNGCSHSVTRPRRTAIRRIPLADLPRNRAWSCRVDPSHAVGFEMILLPIHIVAGLLAITAGAVALTAAKGAAVHRRSGMVFVIAMIAMTSSAVVMAMFFHPNRVNVVAGLLTFYLVCTGLLTVRRPVDDARRWLGALMLLALGVGIYALSLGLEARNAGGRVDSIPAPPLFLFGVVGLIGGLSDARLLAARGIDGARRIARHLWRMMFALWIATTSLFLGQMRHFPLPIRKPALLAIPVVLVLVLMAYWLVRVRVKGRKRVAEPRAVAT